MRLDKLLSECGLSTRSETSRAARAGKIKVNGIPALRPDQKVDPERDEILYCGERVLYQKFLYLMLNKPDGYVSATEDGNAPTVTELFPEEYRRQGIFPCGRLDKHTLGLMLLTNDGVLSHRLLAPKSHVAKTYAFSVKFPLSDADIFALEGGVDIGGYVTKPCKVSLLNPKEGQITIIEGKYHQIKLMMQAVHNQITSLERVSFGPLKLDSALARGAWRPLSQEEIEALRREAHTVEKNP